MKKVVLCNGSFFSLSQKGIELCRKICPEKNVNSYSVFDREDPILIEVIETLGSDSYGPYSVFKIVEIPDNIEYVIHNNNGYETIYEVSRSRSWH